MEDRGVHRVDVADEPEIGMACRREDQPGVLAAEPDRERTVDVDRRHDVAVDLADEHHAGDVEAVGVGDPQSVAELGHHAEALHQRADLRAATVHDDRSQTDRPHEHDVLRELPRETPASAIALPPYFTTTVAPRNRRM